MNTIDKIKKRIKTLNLVKDEPIKEVEVTREEFMQIPDKIKSIDGVKIVVVDKLGDKTKKDCFAYKDKKCSALNDLCCKNRECRFYRNDIKVSDIESSIRKYANYD